MPVPGAGGTVRHHDRQPPVLGPRLREAFRALLDVKGRSGSRAASSLGAGTPLSLVTGTSMRCGSGPGRRELPSITSAAVSAAVLVPLRPGHPSAPMPTT